MLRINLLPSYVTQRRLTRRLTGIFAVLVVLAVAVPLAWSFQLKSQLADISAKADTAEAGKKHTDDLKAQATTTLGQIGPLTTKLQFVKDVQAYPDQEIRFWNTLADKSPRSSFIYTDGVVAGTTATIKAYSPSVEEVGRYLQAMYQEPDFTSVAVDKVPGYPDNVRNLYFLNGVLVFADGSTGGSAGGGGGSISAPSNPFGGGGGGGSAAPAAPSDWNPNSLGPNAPGSLPPGVGPPPPELTGGAPPSGQPGGGTPSGGGTSGTYSANFERIAGKNISPFAPPEVRAAILRKALSRVVKKTVPKGFDLTVTATLKQAFAPPGPPGSAPAGGGPGGRPGIGGPAGIGGPPGGGGGG